MDGIINVIKFINMEISDSITKTMIEMKKILSNLNSLSSSV
ncbi:hypothetical protein Stok01_02156 [Sulfurisphaera tokodaii]